LSANGRGSVVNTPEGSQREATVTSARSDEPAEVYRSALVRNRALADELERRARTVEVARLLTFVLGAIAALLYDEVPVPPAIPIVIATGFFVAFVVLIVRHRALRGQLRRARIAETLSRLGVLRLARDWAGLAAEFEKIGYEDPLFDVTAARAEHPYAYDLDVFGPGSLRALLGPTPTPTGRETLREWLAAPAPIEEIVQRQRAVAALAKDPRGREELTGEALLIDQVDRGGWVAFLGWATGPSVFGEDADGAESARVPKWSIPFSRIAPVLTGGLFTFWFVSAGASALIWLAPLAIQGMLAFRWRRAFASWFDGAGMRAPGLRRHHSLFAGWESYQTDQPRLQALQARLADSSGRKASDEIRSLGWWLDLAGAAGSMVHEIVIVLVLWDVHVAVGLDRWRRRAGPFVADWFDALGELEALSALATLAHDQPSWTFPEMSLAQPGLDATELGHPLLSNGDRCTSDVRVEPPGRFLLVTGSNMSGKSTLLRSIGLGAVMAQAGSVVCASRMQLSPMRTFTSMRIQDSLTGGVSLFMAELLRLKALVDAADVEDDRPLLYLVDEVLQGTNSEERRVAAQRIIRHLLDSNAVGAVTTHDLALHEEPALDSNSTKVHFREHVDDTGGEVLTFDYVLRPGLATSRNALRLLRIVGLDSPAAPPHGS